MAVHKLAAKTLPTNSRGPRARAESGPAPYVLRYRLAICWAGTAGCRTAATPLCTRCAKAGTSCCDCENRRWTSLVSLMQYPLNQLTLCAPARNLRSTNTTSRLNLGQPASQKLRCPPLDALSCPSALVVLRRLSAIGPVATARVSLSSSPIVFGTWRAYILESELSPRAGTRSKNSYPPPYASTAVEHWR